MMSIVLTRRDFRESDQIISLYTKEQGKLELLARGVKKITSKNAAHIEPFSLVGVDIAKGKEIDHLTKVQPLNYFSGIRKDLQKSLAADYVASLVDKVTQVGERDERIFELLEMWLRFVEGLDAFRPVLADGFIVRLFDCLGFRPELGSCVVCNRQPHPSPPLKKGRESGFYFAGGGIICSQCREEKEKAEEQIMDFSPEIKKDLEILLNSDWPLVVKLKLEGDEYNKLHDLIYQYALFHSEKKISDWSEFFR